MKLKFDKNFINKHLLPVLSTEDVKILEKRLFKGVEDEWYAIQRIGELTAKEILSDYKELKNVPENISVVALCGKGKNTADCLCACDYIMRKMPRARISIFMHCSRTSLCPLTLKALNILEQRVKVYDCSNGITNEFLDSVLASDFENSSSINLFLDGLFGIGFKGPLAEPFSISIDKINEYNKIDMRVSIDVPSGLTENYTEKYFKSDFIYLCAIPKSLVFQGNAKFGRIRLIDIGLLQFPNFKFFERHSKYFYLDHNILKHFLGFRLAQSEKRMFGHLYIVGGSSFMPGALLMTVKAAIRSGVGLVTVFAPASIIPIIANQAPEAMWIPLPQNNFGNLSPQAADIILEQIRPSTAMVIGPGLGINPDVEFIIKKILQEVNIPLLLDADALIPRVIELIQKSRTKSNNIVLTPHLGEFLRMTKLASINLNSTEFISLIRNIKATVVLKGAITRISDGESLYLNTRGGPVFSRAGSGDILAGIIGGQLAQQGFDGLSASLLGVLIHGRAGEILAQNRGQIMVSSTEIIEYMPYVLRSY